MRFFFLLLFVVFTSFSQTKIAKGILLDEATNQPIPYVNISILKSLVGTSSDEEGSYSIEISEDDLRKNIILTSLGFKDSIIPVSKFIDQKTILLKAKVEELNEVVISKKFEEEFLVVNPLSKKDIKSGFGSVENPWKLALFFPYNNSKPNLKYLKSIKIFLSKFNEKESRFRLRLFSINENGLPEKDLILESLIIETTKRQREVDIDISRFNLSFPEEGFFICIEVLAIPFNEYENVFNFNNSDGSKSKEKKIVYSPSIGAFYGKKENFKTAYYSNGLWRDHQILVTNNNERIFVPAISLTLSN